MSLMRHRRALRRAVTSPAPDAATPCVAGRPAARDLTVPHVAVLVVVVVVVVAAVLVGLGVDPATAVGTAFAGGLVAIELARRPV